PNLPVDQVAYILRDSGACVAFVSNPDQAAKVAAGRAASPALRHFISFGPPTNGVDRSLDMVETAGAAADRDAARAAFRERAIKVRPDALATIIYTSATTGDPKGVMLTHDNIYSNVMAGAAAIPFAGQDTCLSFLPPSQLFLPKGRHHLM